MRIVPEPLVSVITPTYNHQDYIGECVGSVLCQTYAHWEQIIIDDGSTDRTAQVIQGYRDPRILYHYQKNAGIEALAHTYNRALGLSSGELIAVLEGDDRWPPEKLATMIGAFRDPSVVLCYGEMRELDAKGQIARRGGDLSDNRRRLPGSILNNDPVRTALPYMLTMQGHSLIPASTVLIRRSALDAIGGFKYVPNQCYTDFPTFIRLVPCGKFHYFPKVMGYRRIHPISATAQLPEAMIDRARRHLAELLEQPDFELTQKERSEVERSWRPAKAAVRFTQGRLYLVHRQWSEARCQFRGAIQTTDLRIAIGSLIGWFSSWLHLDLEGLFHMFGRPSMRTN